MNVIQSTAAAPLLRALGFVRRTAIDAWLGRAALVTLRYGLILAGLPTPEALRLVEEHLAICGECQEEVAARAAALDEGAAR